MEGQAIDKEYEIETNRYQSGLRSRSDVSSRDVAKSRLEKFTNVSVSGLNVPVWSRVSTYNISAGHMASPSNIESQCRPTVSNSIKEGQTVLVNVVSIKYKLSVIYTTHKYRHREAVCVIFCRRRWWSRN